MAKTKGTKSLNDLLTGLRADGLKIGTVAETATPTEAWSTGNVALDSITGIGGIPVGRIIEFYGKPSSGKTTAALQTAAVLQDKIISGAEEGNILFLDYENALDIPYAANLGLEVDHPSVVYMAPLTLEDGVNAYRVLLNAGHVRLCIVDSVAAMISEKEAEAETGAVMVADRAKALQQTCRQILAPLRQHRSSIIFLNHILDMIATNPMQARTHPTVTPGGKAIPFYSSLRIEFKQIGTVKTKTYDAILDASEETVTQNVTSALVVKNKVSKPRRQAVMRIRYGRGFSQPFSVLQVLIAHRVIKKSGTWFTLPDHIALGEKTLFQGEEAILVALENDSDTLRKWTLEAQKCLSQYTTDLQTLDEVDLSPGEVVDKETGEIIGGSDAETH